MRHRLQFPMTMLLAAATCVACGSAETTASSDATASDLDVSGDVTATSADATTDVGTGCTPANSSEPGVVVTERGLVRGVQEGGAWSWKGIPYAAPPLGDLRWRDPEPHACWTDVREASAFGVKCLQKDATSGAVVGAEDCLTLNVFAPPTPAQKPLPVLVFIHGGGNIQGSAADTVLGGKPLYAGQHLAATANALVVTLQYRLGPLGWLSLPELTAERAEKSGNQGLRDQIAALAWLQRNVAQFGGDNQHVLVFGESAGAVDVCALATSPAAKGLFSAALMESGNCSQPTQAATETAQATRVDQGSCAKVADRLQCLRAMDAAQLLTELPGSIGIGDATFGSDAGKYGPVVDGALLPVSPIEALAAGQVNPAAFVVGCNSQELAKLLTVKVTTDAQLQAAIATATAALSADAVAQVQAMYAASKYPTPQDAIVALYSDLRFVCPTRGIARAAAKSGKTAVWRYFFSRQAVSAKGPIAASHGMELLYVFGALNDIVGYKPAAADTQLSAAMMGYWGRLAASASPNGAGAVNWPTYGASGDPYLALGDTISALDGVRSAECDLWATLVPGN